MKLATRPKTDSPSSIAKSFARPDLRKAESRPGQIGIENYSSAYNTKVKWVVKGSLMIPSNGKELFDGLVSPIVGADILPGRQ